MTSTLILFFLRLGVSEVDLVREVIVGVNALVDLEKSLEAGNVDDDAFTASIGAQRKVCFLEMV